MRPKRSHIPSKKRRSADAASRRNPISKSPWTAAKAATSNGWGPDSTSPIRAAARCTAAVAPSPTSVTDSAESKFFLRVDPVPEAIAEIPDFQLRITLWDSRETRITVRVEKKRFARCILEQAGVCLLHPESLVTAAYGKIIEVEHGS